VSAEQSDRERKYQAVLSVVATMLQKGVIAEEEYRVIDTIMLEKHRPLLGSLQADYSPNPLDFTGF
jgi:hypothetical protein